MDRINYPREVRARLSRSEASRSSQLAAEFELDALDLEDQYGVQFPRRHLLDRENPLNMFQRPGEFQ